MKKTKSGILILMVIAFLISITPRHTMAINAFVLKSEAKVYLTASDAKAKINAVKTYKPGTYFIYKVEDQTCNLNPFSVGTPGGWINLNEVNGKYYNMPENKLSNNQETKNNTTKVTVKAPVKEKENETKIKGDVITLNKSVEKYVSSYDAKEKTESVGTYVPGNYFIYKRYLGMLNISPVSGTPGAWVNIEESAIVNPSVPATKAEPVKTSPATNSNETSINSKKIVLAKDTLRYIDAYNAFEETDSLGTYPAGSYYIYKSFLGMLNISDTPGVPGSWINPKGVKAPTENSNVSTDVPKSNLYEIKYFTPFYTTIEKAKKMIGAHDGFFRGTYYIIEKKDGMLSLSKDPDGRGRWINPAQNVGASNPASKKSLSDMAEQYLGDRGSEFYTWFGYDSRQEWCAMFVSYLGNKTGNGGVIPSFDTVTDYINYFNDRKSINVKKGFKPEKDMLIMFDWDLDDRPNHIGVVKGSDDNYVYTIEGNANDQVKSLKYKLASNYILGYALPAYPGASLAGQIINHGAWIKINK